MGKRIVLGTAALLATGALGTAGEKPSPVLVELFTSQGCSSCPPADELLSGWGMEQFKKGALLPLAFSVDYWDDLGWKDPFADPAHARRQRDYASVLGDRVYTPQLVVAGQASFVGSDARSLEAAVSRLRGRAPAARLRLEASATQRGLKLSVTAEPLRKPVGRLRIMLALFENGLVTQVKAGENRGSILRNDFVVRRLVDLGALPEDGSSFKKTAEEPWSAGWDRKRGGAAVFLQDAGTLAVLDAASVYPLEP